MQSQTKDSKAKRNTTKQNNVQRQEQNTSLTCVTQIHTSKPRNETYYIPIYGIYKSSLAAISQPGRPGISIGMWRHPLYQNDGNSYIKNIDKKTVYSFIFNIKQMLGKITAIKVVIYVVPYNGVNESFCDINIDHVKKWLLLQIFSMTKEL